MLVLAPNNNPVGPTGASEVSSKSDISLVTASEVFCKILRADTDIEKEPVGTPQKT